MAMTRAEKGVKLSFAQSRTKWGTHTSNSPSRFIKEIDKEYILNPLTDWEDELRTKFDRNETNIGLRNYGQRSQSGVSQRVGPGMDRKQVHVQPHPQFKKPVAQTNFIPDSPSKVEVGQTIEHDRFGIGVVVSLEGELTSRKAVVDFKIGGRKTLLLKFAKIRVVAQ